MAISNTVTYTANSGGITIDSGGSYGSPDSVARSNLRNDALISGVAQEFRERKASSLSITAATAAEPVVLTSAGHGLQNGTRVQIAGVAGMVELNGNEYTLSAVTANTLSLQTAVALGASSSDVDGGAFTAYTSGGTVTVHGISGTATVSLG